MKTLRIFISSPSDVRSERVRAYDIVQRLQAKFRAFIRIETILWEDEPMRATASFQQQIPKPSESDVVVCVLWARIGMRLPQEYKRPDGTVPTGTEWEFEDALDSYKKKGTPDLLVYRKVAQSSILADNIETVKEWVSQKEALDTFLDKWFRDHEGAFKAAFNSFNNEEEFEKLLTTHLEKNVSLRLDKPEPIIWTEGSPFRGLDIFDLDHKEIFFGRDLAVAEITHRLLEQSSRGRAFLIVLGMSGCGKSSLVRAGVLAELMRPGVVEDVGCWRWAVMRPSEASGTLTECLASVLYSEKSALPELADLGYDQKKFAALLQDAPTHAIPLVEAALTKAARQFAKDKLRSNPPEARLVLVIDQLEEMFTAARFDAPQRSAFIHAISALCRSGLVWVITTMRSDLYARCAEIDELLALKSDDGQYDLAPPGVAEIGQIIRLPAIAAGLVFEAHPVTHQKLDDALQEEASRNLGALPLLEFCLDELYKRKTEAHLITWDAYEKLGRLNGAIARRAEDVFEDLSPAAKEAFPRVIASLLTMDAVVTSHPVRHKDLSRDAAMEEVVVAFTRDNLFITDIDQAGEPLVAVAHEALIKSWPRVQNWVHENQDFLRLKARIAQAAHRWRESNKENDFLLPEGKPLAEAEDALRKNPKGLENDDFILASIKLAARRRHKRQGLVAAVVTLVLSIVFGAIWLRKVQMQKAQSEVDYVSAVGEMKQNEVSASLAYLADAMKNNPANEKAVALTVAELHNFLLPAIVLHHNGEVHDASFSPDGSLVVTASSDGTAQVWDAKTGKPIGAPMRHNGWVHAAEFSPDGTKVATASYDGTAQIWDARTGRPLLPNGLRTADPSRTKVYSAMFSNDSTRIATAASDGTAQIWDVQTGKQIGETMFHGKDEVVWSAHFNPAGTQVLTASIDGTARVWDAWTGKPILVSGKPVILQHQHKDEMNNAFFSHDGKWIVTVGDDGTAQLWDAQTFQKAGEPMQHGGKVGFADFSPDNKFVVTSSLDHTARIWQVVGSGEATKVEPYGAIMHHDGWVRAAFYSPDGRAIITCSYDRTARVWDAKGLPLGQPMRHSGTIYMARFGKDNSSIVTASFNHTAQIWKWQPPRTLPPMHQPGAMVSAIFDASGKSLASVSAQGVQIWDAKTGLASGQPMIPNSGGDNLKGASYSPDGKWLLTISKNGAQVWNTVTGGRVSQPIEISDLLTASFSPDGHEVMTASGNEVQLWDAQSSKPILTQPIRPDGILSGAGMSPDGRTVVSYTYNGNVDLWNAQTGAAILSKSIRHKGRIFTVNFSSDSKWLVVASADHTARVWNALTGEAVSAPMQHDSFVIDAEFSADGRWVVTASGDQTAKIWNAQTGQAASPAMRQKDAVIAAHFSPDGRWVVTVTQDGIVQVWGAQTGLPMGPAFSSSGKVVSAVFSPDSNWILTAADDGTAQMWEAPITTKLAPKWLIDAAESLGGWSLDKHGVLQPSPQQAIQLREKLSHLTGKDEVSRFGRWLVEDPATRPLSPKLEQ